MYIYTFFSFQGLLECDHSYNFFFYFFFLFSLNLSQHFKDMTSSLCIFIFFFLTYNDVTFKKKLNSACRTFHSICIIIIIITILLLLLLLLLLLKLSGDMTWYNRSFYIYIYIYIYVYTYIYMLNISCGPMEYNTYAYVAWRVVTRIYIIYIYIYIVFPFFYLYLCDEY